MNHFIREPFNALSHLFGAILSIIGIVFLLIKAEKIDASLLSVASLLIFGISMTLLYLASASYHTIKGKDTLIYFFRKIDHSMIFLLIAGTYAPFCLIALKGNTGYVLFTIVSGLAILGVLFKMVWFACPRWVSTALYIGMGWIIVILAVPLAKVIGSGGMLFLILGGVFYTIGGVIYGVKPKISFIRKLGFHEIFHVFILLGSLCHFVSIYVYTI